MKKYFKLALACVALMGLIFSFGVDHAHASTLAIFGGGFLSKARNWADIENESARRLSSFGGDRYVSDYCGPRENPFMSNYGGSVYTGEGDEFVDFGNNTS